MDVIEQAALIVEERLGKYTAEGSADAIARMLEARDVKAVCGNAARCAIAQDLLNAITAELGENDLEVAVTGTDRVAIMEHSTTRATQVQYMTKLLYVGADWDDWMCEARAYYATNPINEFVQRFDNGEYSKLIAA